MLFLYWDKNTNGFNKNNKFLSITDYSEFLVEDYKSLRDIKPKESILIEDFKSVASTIDQTPNIWMYKKLNEELVFNSFQLTEYFNSKNELFMEVIKTFPHLKYLLEEYIVFNGYLNMKSSKITGNQYYFDGKMRKTSFNLIFFKRLVTVLRLMLPPVFYIALKKLWDEFKH